MLVALTLVERAEADERPPAMPFKAPPAAAKPYDWGGLYIGGHFGAAWGRSDWSAAGGLPLSGSFDLAHGYNAFKGTGSYFAGLQAGYNAMLPNHILLGAEADISFPNTIEGSQTFSSVSTGTASFAEQAQFFGTVRGRIGYAPGGWLLYATGGLAWSYEEFSRTQLAGVPANGTRFPAPSKPAHGATNGLGRRCGNRSCTHIVLECPPRIPVDRLRQPQCLISGRSAFVQFRPRPPQHPARPELSNWSAVRFSCEGS